MHCKTKLAGTNVMVNVKLLPEFENTEAQRAVYIFFRPCIQSLKGPVNKYLNLVVRPMRKYKPFCHWGLFVSSHFPPEGTKAGDEYKPEESLTTCSSAFEMEVVGCRQSGKHANVGCFESVCPTNHRKIAGKVIYVGTTSKSDAELDGTAHIIVDYMNIKGGYHGLYRNCQHFLVFLASMVTNEEKFPKRADEIFGGILAIRNKDCYMDEKLGRLRDYHRVRRNIEAAMRIEEESICEDKNIAEQEKEDIEDIFGGKANSIWSFP